MTERHRKNIQGFLQILSRQETLCASQEQTKTLSYGNHREVRARFFYYYFVCWKCQGHCWSALPLLTPKYRAEGTPVLVCVKI